MTRREMLSIEIDLLERIADDPRANSMSMTEFCQTLARELRDLRRKEFFEARGETP